MRNNYYTVIWRDYADGDFCMLHIENAKSAEAAINRWLNTGMYDVDFDPSTLPFFIVLQGKVSNEQYGEIVQREAAVNV